jgi:proliferating cell nuclear antigen
MFTIKFTKADSFKKVIEALKDLFEVISFEVTKEGLSFQAMDKSRVSLVSMQMDPDFFSEFKTTGNVKWTVRTQSLHQVLKCAQYTDSLTLLNDEGTNRLHLKYSSLGTSTNSSFILNLINNSEEDIEIPVPVIFSRVIIPAAEFARIIRELNQISETVYIEVSAYQIAFGVKNDMISGETVLKNNFILKQLETIKIEVDGVHKGEFSLEMLTHFCRAGSVTEHVVLHFSEEAPLVAEYKIDSHGCLKFFLAPKLD